MRALLRRHRPLAGLRCALLACAALAPVAAESLFTAETLADGTLYSDQVARRIGDLITIRVVERMSIVDEQETETSRETTMQAGLDAFPNSARVPVQIGADNTGRLPGFAVSSTKEFEGEGSYEADSAMTVTLSGRVIDVLDNGNLVIEARRRIAHNQDSKTVTLTGVVRRADIDSQNTVASSQIHNFEVAVEGEGPLSRSQQEGWLSRLLDVVWPF